MSVDESVAAEGRKTFPVVAIGASAGGLEALRQLFGQLPDETGMAFVVIQHLGRRREGADHGDGHGIGIRSEIIPHLFNRFVQAETAMTRAHGGLGLAIVRHLVEVHAGEVHVDSEGEGMGTTFTVTLPLAAKVRAVKEEQPRKEPRSVAPSIDGVRVLLIEDGYTFITKLEITLDQNSLSVALLGTALPLDPGTHSLIARRLGRTAVTMNVEVPKGPSAQTVQIPRLAEAPPMDLGFGPTSRVDPGTANAPSVEWKRPAGWIGVGVGVAGVGVATYFGLQAASKHEDGNAHCTSNLCDEEGLDLQSDARSSATISTISGVVGIVSLGVGAFLLLTAPPRATAIRSRRGGFEWRGEF